MSQAKRHRNRGGELYGRGRKGAGRRRPPLSAPLRQLGAFLRRNRKAVRGWLIFSGLILVFTLAYVRLEGSRAMDALRAATASATGFMLEALGVKVQVMDTWVSSPDFSMGIIAACTGVVPMAIVISAVLAYPSSFRQKGEGIALAVAGIYIANLLRTVSLFLVGSHLPQLFDTAHYIVWQSLMMLLAIGLWLLWVETRVNVPQR